MFVIASSPSSSATSAASARGLLLFSLSKQLADASQGVPEVPEQVDDGIHASLIADKAGKRNLT